LYLCHVIDDDASLCAKMPLEAQKCLLKKIEFFYEIVILHNECL